MADRAMVHLRNEFRELLSVSSLLVFCFGVAAYSLEFFSVLPLHVRPTPVQELHLSDGSTAYLRNLMYDNAYVPDGEQVVPVWLLFLLSISIPLAVLLVCAATLRVRGDVVNFLHGFIVSMACMEVTMAGLKNYVGYLRPYFYGECGWDQHAGACSGALNDDAHKSFPSGHASAAFCSFLYTSLYMLGKVNPVNPTSITLPFGRLDCTNGLLLFALSPMAVAAWIASSRVVENDHHPADIICGGLVGCFWAAFWYARYYPGIFADDSRYPRDADAHASAGEERDEVREILLS